MAWTAPAATRTTGPLTGGERETLTGSVYSVRTVYVHMIAEYARHIGHADLLRERLDGTTGA